MPTREASVPITGYVELDVHIAFILFSFIAVLTSF